MNPQGVQIPNLRIERLDPLIGERAGRLRTAADWARRVLSGRVLWNVNSTSRGGGVAEMLIALLGYARGAGVDARWTVIEGDGHFFEITKRLHNHLHGFPGDDGAFRPVDAHHYAHVLAQNAEVFLEQVRPDDIVVLHDPQTAGLAPALRASGAKMVWRCHIGVERRNQYTERAWGFLRSYLVDVDALVFSRKKYIPGWVDKRRVAIIAPSIDPFSPKNQELDERTTRLILARAGIIADAVSDTPNFTRTDGSVGEVVRSSDVVSLDSLPGPEDPLVVQISRWDPLKDMLGVMLGFADAASSMDDAHLVLAGPAVSAVTDDPEGQMVLDQCVAAWRLLSPRVRAQIHLVCLPMDDVEENAAIVNALQRHASVIVQKSLAEGFGLTVMEGMWKCRAVVASGVGGIRDQLTADTGVSLKDPTDLVDFGSAVAQLLHDREEAERLGRNARERVRARFLADRHLLDYANLLKHVLEG